MQPVEAQKGVSIKSQLFDSLRVYLNNKNRLQPIIGLGSIIECVKAGAHNGEALYLCEVCVCRLSKADMRNHIMGSLHRYNYIKTCHAPSVSEWKEKSDLSKLAWPLMDIAKILEEKEGHGDVQLLEVEDVVYQKMATHNENNALTLINLLRDGHTQGQGEPESHSETVQPERYPIQSQRLVLPQQNKWIRSKKSLKTSAETNKPLIQSPVASVSSEVWLNNTPASLLDNTRTPPKPRVLSENSNSFLDGYTGSEPLIGLFRVVECRSEDGRTYCFLCHCCRIRSNKKDIIDHLTSSSHLVNYLMETHPKQVEVMMADVTDHLLQTLAKKVEQEEGRGELKVVNAPESLCILLTGKSYHWLLEAVHKSDAPQGLFVGNTELPPVLKGIKMLCGGWTHTYIHKRKIAFKGPCVNKTSHPGVPQKCAMVLSKWTKSMTTKREMRKVKNTVFKISLPLATGSVLLERTSLSVDNLPVSSACSPSPDSELIPSPEFLPDDCELDCDTGSFAINHAEHTSQLEQDRCRGYADAGQYMGPERHVTVTQYQGNHYFGDNEYFN